MLRKLTLAFAAATLALGTFATATTAQTTADVQILNGIPVKVDFCAGKDEFVSGLRYGRSVWWRIEAGTYKWAVRKAAPGKCTGKWLGVVTATWSAGEDYTSVIWKPYAKLKIKTFANDLDVPQDKAKVVVRHVARVPNSVDVWVWEHVRSAMADWSPTIDDLRRGASSGPVTIRPGQFYVDIYASRTTPKFSWEGYHTRTDANQVRWIYLIGNKKTHTKIVGYYADGNPIAPAP